MKENSKVLKDVSIEPISQVTLADRVEHRLIKFLQEKNLEPGDTIPTELEFAKALKVSRNVVREALSRLKMLGYVKAKKNRGMVMSYPDVMKVFGRVLDPLLMSKETQLSLMELRISLETGIADLLIKRKTEEDISELEELLNNETVGPTGDVSKKDNINFHTKLYQITRNEYLEKFHVLLEQIFTYVYDYLEERGEHLAVSPATHRVILNELKSGSADSLRDAIRSHLQPHMDIINIERGILNREGDLQ